MSTGSPYYTTEHEAFRETVRRFIDRDGRIEQVIFCCFAAADLAVYQGLLAT